MLMIYIWNTETQITTEICSFDDYVAFEEGIYTEKANEQLSQIAESINMLGRLDPEVNCTSLLEQLEACTDNFIEQSVNESFGHYDISKDFVVIPTGEFWEIELFKKAREKGCLITDWYNEIEELCLEEKAKLHWLLIECGYDYDYSIGQIENSTVYRQPLNETAEIIFEDLHQHKIPEGLQSYIDHEHFAAELGASGQYSEFEFAGFTWTAQKY